MTTIEEHAVFLRAREIIEERNWWGGGAFSASAIPIGNFWPICVGMALRVAVNGEPMSDYCWPESPIYERFLDLARLSVSLPWPDPGRQDRLREVIVWNDRMSGGKQNVLAALDRCIEATAPKVPDYAPERELVPA